MPSHKELVNEHRKLEQALSYAVHELPLGILYGTNGATEKQCAEWMRTLEEFQVLSNVLSIEYEFFTDDCRWHFEHYAHYLGRRRHFQDYEQYILERKGQPFVRNN